jgi:hypothetical protein
MKTTYTIHAPCVRPFVAGFEVEASSPEDAITIAREEHKKLLEDSWCNSLEEFIVHDEYGTELFRTPVDVADSRSRSSAAEILLDMVRHGVISLADNEAEFEGVAYAFEDIFPDWNAVLNFIGRSNARAAIVRARAS